MTKFIALLGGKGGVGKTVISINLTLALSKFKRDVLLIDANFKNPDIGLYLGEPFLDNTLNDALARRKSITDCAFLYKDELKVVFSKVDGELEKLDHFCDVLIELNGKTEAVIADVNFDDVGLLNGFDDIILVTTPELPSVVESMRKAKQVRAAGLNVAGIIINRYHGDYMDMSLSDIESLVDAPVISVLSEDLKMRCAIKDTEPILNLYPESIFSVGIKKLAAKLIGYDYVYNIEKEGGYSFYHRFKRRLGI